MGNKKKNIDKLFAKGFENFSPETPYDGWQGIQESLAKKKRKKRIIYWRYNSIAAAVILAFFSGYFFNNSSSQKDNGLQKINTPITPNENVISNHDNPISKKIEKSTTPLKTIEKNVITNKNTTTPQIKTITVDISGNKSNEKPLVSLAVLSPKKIVLSSQNPKTLPLKNIPFLHYNSTTESIVETTVPDDNKNEEAPLHFYTKSKDKKDKHIEMALLGGPSFPFRNTQYNPKDQQAITDYTQENIDNESLENAFAGGLKMAYQTDNNWEFQAGFMVNNWSQNSSNIRLEGPDPNKLIDPTNKPSDINVNGNVSSGGISFNYANTKDIAIESQSISLSSPNEYYLIPNISQQYQFVEIPVGAAYYILKSKFQIKAQLGLNSRFLSQSTVQLEYPDGAKEDFDGLKIQSFSLQLNGGPGFAYQFNKRFKIQVDPLFYYGLTPVNKNSEVETYFHQFLIFSGFSYRF